MSLENSFLEAGILESNYFDLFSLPLSFDVDQKQLKKRFRALQRSYHPDRYASATASERRLAAQFSAHINTAHTTLENPTLRAEHMLGVVGIDADTSTTTIRDPEFLMRQMELREQFDDAVQAGNLEQLQSLAEEVGVQYLQCQTAFSMQIASFKTCMIASIIVSVKASIKASIIASIIASHINSIEASMITSTIAYI